MRFAAAATVAALAGAASAAPQMPAAYNGTAPVYTTEVVTAYTTFCPEATMLTHMGETYTVSSATTLTITNCPGGCTITHAASTTPVAPVPYTSVPVETSASSVASPVAYTSSSTVPVAPIYPSSNGTAPVYPTGTGSPVTGSATGSSIPTYTGAANQAYSAAGAGFLALFGLVAAL